jgi:hypothetical protein
MYPSILQCNAKDATNINAFAGGSKALGGVRLRFILNANI